MNGEQHKRSEELLKAKKKCILLSHMLVGLLNMQKWVFAMLLKRSKSV